MIDGSRTTRELNKYCQLSNPDKVCSFVVLGNTPFKDSLLKHRDNRNTFEGKHL